MTTRLTLLCHAATRQSREGGFPSLADTLDTGGVAKAKARMASLPTAGTVLMSPALAAIETATALGLTAAVDPALKDADYGFWAGRGFAELRDEDPSGLSKWLASPEVGAPGGESFDALTERMTDWLKTIAMADRSFLAITHAMTIRGIIAVALEVPNQSAMRIDIAPLSIVVLSFNRTWRLQAIRQD